MREIPAAHACQLRWFIIKNSAHQSGVSISMIRFLQKPGPLKKIILGGILLVICVMMVITLVPGGMFGDYLGGGLTTQGVLAKVGDQERRRHQVAQQARLIGQAAVSGQCPSNPDALPDAARGARHDHPEAHGV